VVVAGGLPDSASAWVLEASPSSGQSSGLALASAGEASVAVGVVAVLLLLLW
jgi:hypothetical protein